VSRAIETGDVDLIVDTNVQMDIISLGDLIKARDECPTLEAAASSPILRFRQLRARHSLVLAYQCAKNGTRTGSLVDESIDVLRNNVAPKGPSLTHQLTQVIVHVIRPIVLQGWVRGALMEVPVGLRGSLADDELLKAAQEFGVPLITNEGLTLPNSTSAKKKSRRNLRARCKAIGVPCYTPEEYLHLQNVDIAAEAAAFLNACHSALARGRAERLVYGAQLEQALDKLLEIFHFVMLFEP
jgi:hypothetical protein